MPVVIEPEQPSDLAAIRRVVLAAFDTHQEVADLVDLIRASPQFVPELSLVARLDGELVGHVMLSRAELEDDHGVRRELLTLSPLAVTPAHQRQGIGSALVPAGLVAAEAMGERLVVLEGSPRYYPRFGFRDCRTLGIDITLPDWAPAEAGMAYPLTAYDDAWRAGSSTRRRSRRPARAASPRRCADRSERQRSAGGGAQVEWCGDRSRGALGDLLLGAHGAGSLPCSCVPATCFSRARTYGRRGQVAIGPTGRSAGAASPGARGAGTRLDGVGVRGRAWPAWPRTRSHRSSWPLARGCATRPAAARCSSRRWSAAEPPSAADERALMALPGMRPA